MIFDDYDDLSGNQITLTPNSKKEREPITSLDNFMANKEECLKNDNYSNFYDLYQLHINKTFLKNSNARNCRKSVVKRQSTVSKITKKKKGGNFLLLLTDKKEKPNKMTESGVDYDEVSIKEIKGSISVSSEDSSLLECDFNDSASIKSKKTCSIENEASIDKKTQAENTMRPFLHKKTGMFSLNLLTNKQSSNLLFRRTKSADQINNSHMSNEEYVKIESFVSLDEIVRKSKHIKAEDEICSICTKGYNLNDFIARLCVCNHIFHKQCIDLWIKQSDIDDLRCPLCKKAI